MTRRAGQLNSKTEIICTPLVGPRQTANANHCGRLIPPSFQYHERQPWAPLNGRAGSRHFRSLGARQLTIKRGYFIKFHTFVQRHTNLLCFSLSLSVGLNPDVFCICSAGQPRQREGRRFLQILAPLT